MCCFSPSNLWYFVSKFTEYDPQKLYRVYKKAVLRREGVKQSSSKSNADASGGDTKSKDKDKEKKHKKHKKDKGVSNNSSRSTANNNDNSNSSFGDNSGVNQKGNHSSPHGNYNRGNHGGPVGNKQVYNNVVQPEYDRNSNDAFPTTYGQYNRAKYAAQSMPNGPPTHYPQHDAQAHIYRERPRDNRAPLDPRAERAPGDPRDRGSGGAHYNKSYNHYEGNRQGISRPHPNSGRGGGWDKNR